MKAFVGPRLRQLRREHGHTQADMAQRLGVSPAYINLIEHNQRTLSVRILVGLLQEYGVDWHDLIGQGDDKSLNDLRVAAQDPVFGGAAVDLRELRDAMDNAPAMTERFLKLYGEYRMLLENMMRLGHERMPVELISSSAETVVHDFFRSNLNHFPELEAAAERLGQDKGDAADNAYAWLKERLLSRHGISTRVEQIDTLGEVLRIHDADTSTIVLSEALDHINRTFQLAHILGFVECGGILDTISQRVPDTREMVVNRCKVELANYFAAAILMPYDVFLDTAQQSQYDIDRLAARFGVSFEQVCHRLTTLQREGRRGIPFFFLRVDKAGNVTKRFNATTFQIAEYGGSCPVWNIHTAFRTPGVILPQFVELPDGERFFTLSRTTERPSFSRDTQDRRLVLSLGCSIEHVEKITYALPFPGGDKVNFSQIGINCHLCSREACSQRAHQPILTELKIDPSRRGSTRYDA